MSGPGSAILTGIDMAESGTNLPLEYRILHLLKEKGAPVEGCLFPRVKKGHVILRSVDEMRDAVRYVWYQQND